MALFSATIPYWLEKVAKDHMRSDRFVIDLAQDLKNKTAKNVNHIAILTKSTQLFMAFSKVLDNCYEENDRIITFCARKDDANKLSGYTRKSLAHIRNGLFHGDIDQQKREQTLQEFKSGQTSLLIASDAAQRGLDIPNV